MSKTTSTARTTWGIRSWPVGSFLSNSSSIWPARANLDHHILAVGRWQKNKDLSWYAKGDESDAAQAAANARAEEIRMIKEAEQDALSKALGFEVQPRANGTGLTGANALVQAVREPVKTVGVEGTMGQEMNDRIGEKKEKAKRNGIHDRERHVRHRKHDGDGHRRHQSRSRERTVRRRSRSRSYDRRGSELYKADDRSGKRRSRSRSRSYERLRELNPGTDRAMDRTRQRRSRSRNYDRVQDNERRRNTGPRRSRSPSPRRRDGYRGERR